MSAHHPSPPPRSSTAARADVARRLAAGRARRRPLAASADTTAYRVVDGAGDGLPGIALDRYGPCAILDVDADVRWPEAAVTDAAHEALRLLAPDGVEAVYVKRFVRDRSRLGGRFADETRSATPRAGTPQPEVLEVREHGLRFEIHPYDGLSTGLFLEHREHRRALAERQPPRALNLFAYTCAFAAHLGRRGAHVTNVDVSSRYLAWGRRNLALNAVPNDRARFLRRDAREFLRAAARRPAERFDLVILDPPTFAAADRRRGVASWRAVDDYPALVRDAVTVLAPGGAVFAATNTRELAAPGALARMIVHALGAEPAWQSLPPWPLDVTAPERVAAVLFVPR